MQSTERTVKVTIEVTSITGERTSESYLISVDEYRKNPHQKTMLSMLTEKFFAKLENLNNRCYDFLNSPGT